MGSGGQPGNRNAWQHGEYSAAAKADRRAVRALIAELRADAERLVDGGR